jgi:hypothetical protein
VLCRLPTHRTAGAPERDFKFAACSDCVGRHVELVGRDVRVAADSREVGVAKVLRDEASVSSVLAKPCRGGVAERVCSHVLIDSGAFGGVADDESC